MPEQPQQPRERILVIKLGALGDFIQALGPMKAIRAHHPGAHITLFTTRPYAGFGKECGYFDSVILDHKPKWYQPRSWLALRAMLNQGRFTRVYDLQNNDRTAFYLKLFSPKPEWVGAAKGASHRNNSPERTAGHAFDGHVQTLALAGVQNVAIDRLEWMQGTPDKFPALQPPYVLLVPGCAPSRPEKRWPREQYAALAQGLIADGLQPVLIGTQDEAETNQFIVNSCAGCLNLTGETALRDIVSLARGAMGTIGNDTGPIHLIAATGCRTLALFSGHSNAIKHTPQGAHASIMQVPNLQDLSAKDVLTRFRSSSSPP